MDSNEKEQLLEKGQQFCNQASEYNSRHIYSKALESYEQAEQCFKQVKDHKWLNFVAHEKLQLLWETERLNEALQLADQVISAYHSFSDFKGLALAMTHKANIQMDKKDYYDALSTLRLAEQVAIENNIHESIGYIYSTMSINFWELENYISAIEALNKALPYYPQDRFPNEYAWCCHYIGLSYKAIYFFSKAEEFLEKSYSTYLKVRDIQSALTPMESLRKIYQSSGQKEKSKRMHEMIIQTGGLNTKM